MNKPSRLFLCLAMLLGGSARAREMDLTNAVIAVRPPAPLAERTAAVVLSEELEKRTGLAFPRSTGAPSGRPVISVATRGAGKPDGYEIVVERSGPGGLVRVTGNDPRGTLFGVGQLLRRLDWAPGSLHLDDSLHIRSAPAYPIRGHQLGYRPQANSYDAWSPAQFEQYIRELTFFGVNSIEGIPFHDDRKSEVMKFPRREINRAIGEICHRYGLDYWAWVPADFDLKDTAKRAAFLERCRQFFADTPELTGIFFPGGDPGDNPPELVLPFLKDMAALLLPLHPRAKIWLSLQGFHAAQIDTVYAYLLREQPDWLGGLVGGPSAPPLDQTRRRLPARYGLRDYPDLTHNKICQYEVPTWDQAFALTLGREAINPRPAEFALIHNRMASYTDGFISYSDGVHDDVNKTIWSALSWDPRTGVRDILADYARVYFSPAVANGAADGILALERNWRGPAVGSGSIEGTLLLWQQLEKRAPGLETNWRWQMCLLRANYDAYIRRRLIYETGLENQANAVLENASAVGADHSMRQATEILEQAVTAGVSPNLRARIFDLCDRLFHSIGLQTSVDKYYASGEERGAVLDFVDYPLNNRWWLEDQFQAVAALGSEGEKVQRLRALAEWEHPGPGSFYDAVGDLSKSPHVERVFTATADETSAHEEPMFWWLDNGKSRARLTWQVTLWPTAVVYEALDPRAAYVVRSSGYGQALLRLNGERVQPTRDGRQMGDIKEFPVDAKYLRGGKLTLTWDHPTGEENLNWRKQSRLAEVWLIRK